MSSSRILIVDDHDAVRLGLRSMLSARPEWVVCGEAVDGLDAIEKTRALRPDLVLMDISMPRMDGLEATRLIRKELPNSQVIIISQNDPAVARRQAHAVGAVGHIAKLSLSEELLPTLDRIVNQQENAASPASEEREVDSTIPIWLAGGGELSKLIWNHDWRKSPLGPIGKWPQSLKTSLSLILNSQHPMWIGWGPDVTFFYNDAYVQVLSLAKHPNALGRPAAQVWSEVWDICGPLVDKVYGQGEASFLDDIRFFMNRGDILEESFYSFSYSPIRDESGNVAGLFCPTTEVTPRVINARRLRTLAELSDKSLTQKTEESACSSAIATLAKNPDDIPFALLYIFNGENKTARLEQVSGLPEGKSDLTPASIDLSDESGSPALWPIAAVVESDQSQVISIQGMAGLPAGLANQPLHEAIVLPVTSRGEDRPLGVLVAGINPTRRLDADYRTFYELIAGQIATAIQNARSAEEERNRLEALAEIDRAKTVFFSNVSHEFRTPLTLMLGPVEELLARSHTDLSPSAKSQLELVNRNGSRLLRLVNTLLDFSRIEAGRMQARYQLTDLAAFTAELASVFRSATERAGLNLEIDCEKLVEPVYVDRNMWEKIVLNLISNAFKFTFEGSISVSLKQAGNSVELRVSDTGVGIPKRELPHLFDRFHRIENARSRTHEGSGIGLALVNELVQLHGGSVSVESVPERGSTFTVSVPVGNAHLPADQIGGDRSFTSTNVGANPFVEEALRWLPDKQTQDAREEIPSDELIPFPCPPVSEDGAESGHRPFILVADDNADMRQYLVRLLAERYEVQSVPDGQAALDAIRVRQPELVLTDVMMPHLDGFGLLRELRSDPSTRTIPIIVLSARAGEESRVEGMEKGADDYLIKPFSARELLARVQTHLELARIRKQSEQALSQRTAQFETLFNEAPLGVYLVDADFRLREVNPTARRMFGDIPSLIGRDFEELIHILWPAAYAKEIVERFRHTLESGEPYVVPERIENRADRGNEEIYEWQINRISLPDGRYGVVCYFRDIATQVRTREVLRESQDRLRHMGAIVDSSNDAIISMNLEGAITSWNGTAERMFGYTAKEAVGQHIRLIIPAERLNEDVGILERIKRGDRVEHIETVRVRKNGERIDISLTISPVRDAEGRIMGASKVARDITERRRTQEALRQQERRLRLATEVAELGIWHWYPDKDEVVWENDRIYEIMGRTREEGPLNSAEFIRTVLHADDLEAHQRTLGYSLMTGERFFFQGRIKRKDGTIGWVELNGQIEPQSKGALRRMLGTAVDVTQRKQAEQILLQHRERIDLVAQAANVGFWFCDLPFDKLNWDERVKEHFYLPPDAEVTIDTFFEQLHPDDRERTRHAIAASNANDIPYDIEFRAVARDGRVKWIRAMGRTFYDAKRQPIRFDGITLDITERKRAEQREQKIIMETVAATAKFRAVFEQTPVFAVIMALDGTVIDANRLSLEACGYREDQVLGRLFWETGWWRVSKDVQSKIRKATALAAKGIPSREILKYYWADGTEHIVDFAIHPIVDERGNILFLHPTGVDITDLKRAEENFRTLAETLDAEVRARTRELEERNLDVLNQSGRLRDLSHRLIQIQDEERRHIARELHDSAGQTLAVLGMNLQTLMQKVGSRVPDVMKVAEESQQMVRELSNEIRTTSYLLHPPLLDETGIGEALRWFIEGLMDRSGMNITLAISENFGRLMREMELAIFRIVQECLTNVHRHSGSKSAAIRISRDARMVSVEVEDQGKGISRERLLELQSQGTGVGIRGMRERVNRFGGEIRIHSEGAGTSIIVSLPLVDSALIAPQTAVRQEQATE